MAMDKNTKINDLIKIKPEIQRSQWISGFLSINSLDFKSHTEAKGHLS